MKIFTDNFVIFCMCSDSIIYCESRLGFYFYHCKTKVQQKYFVTKSQNLLKSYLRYFVNPYTGTLLSVSCELVLKLALAPS
jgi:hypothetical protein